MTPAEIKAFRKRKGWTQLEMATILGVTPSAIHYWETGRSHPTGLSQRALERLMRKG